jgi:phage tail sheath protein FI
MSVLDKINVRRLVDHCASSTEQIIENFKYEPNDSISRSAVKSNVDRFLQAHKANRSLCDYKVICDNANNSASQIDRGNLVVDLYIKPTASGQFVPLNVQMVPEPHPLQKLGLTDSYDIMRWRDDI